MKPLDFFLMLRILLRTRLSSYSTELIILVLSFITTVLVVNWVDLLNRFLPPVLGFIKREDYWPLNFGFVRTILWIFLFLLISWLWSLKKRNHGRDYNFKFRDWPDHWIIQGGSIAEFNPPRLLIRMSESGCLLKKYLWKNFRMKFQMKFLMDEFRNDSKYTMRNLGILFKASNLDSYYMLEIISDNGGKLYAKPHVRYLGDWEVIDLIYLCKVDTAIYIKVKLDVQNEIAALSINGELFYQWILPTHVDINHRVIKVENQEGSKSDKKINGLFDDKQLGDSYVIPEIPFRNDFGKIGFRAYPGQGAIIKGLTINSNS